MGPALFPITLEAMKSENDAVALQVRISFGNWVLNKEFIIFLGY